jgi:hypothetical protein
MATPNNVPDRKALQSWKEIATFLGVTVRSVQRWESGGLPVYRQGDGRKARVFAYPDELKQWLEAGDLRGREPASEAVTAPLESPPLRYRIPRKAWGAAAGLAVALAAVVFWRTGVFPPLPFPRTGGWLVPLSGCSMPPNISAGKRRCRRSALRSMRGCSTKWWLPISTAMAAWKCC